MAKDEKESLRNPEGAWAAAGFAVVLLVVGVPVWWFTTTVYRAQLPYGTIETLSGQLRHHTVGVTIIGSPPESFQEDLAKSLRSMGEFFLPFNFFLTVVEEVQGKKINAEKERNKKHVKFCLVSSIPLSVPFLFK